MVNGCSMNRKAHDLPNAKRFSIQYCNNFDTNLWQKRYRSVTRIYHLRKNRSNNESVTILQQNLIAYVTNWYRYCITSNEIPFIINKQYDFVARLLATCCLNYVWFSRSWYILVTDLHRFCYIYVSKLLQFWMENLFAFEN